MTSLQKQTYRHRWDRFQLRYEAIYTPKFHKALKEQVAQVVDRVNGSSSIGVWMAAIGAVKTRPMEDVLLELYQQVGPLWASYTKVHKEAKLQVKARLPMGFSDRIVQLMRDYYGIDIFLDAVTITENTKKYIADVLSEAAEAGWSFDQIVKELGAKPELSAMRARRIARTETVTAANGAALINAKESGLAMDKVWISVRDNRTRQSHRMEDNTRVNVDDPFKVGKTGALMMAPGVRKQPDGSPVPLDEFINCRCTVAFIVKRDERGRIVRLAA